MKCTICREGVTEPGTATVTVERDGCIVLVKEVPADVCPQCGEFYLSEEISAELFRRATAAIQQGAELQVLRWAA
jgi:YgiT-type zinc finger domain-containing protein